MRMESNKRGSVTIMVIMIFVSLMILVGAFINASIHHGVEGCVASLGKVWGRSILGEYDIRLHEQYGLFGFYGYDNQIAKKLDTYAKYTFSEKKYIKYGGCSCILEKYSLTKPQNFKRQIEDIGKLAFLKEKMTEQKAEELHTSKASGNLRNRGVIDSLPSKGVNGGTSIARAINFVKSKKSIKSLCKDGVGASSQIQYLFNYYKHEMDDKGLGATFFNNEIEYVICGQKSDYGNRNKICSKIITLRTAFNLAFLEANTRRRNEALAMAEVLTPGPAAFATMQGILALWALLESENDYKLLMAGISVPYFKVDQTWAIDLDSAMNKNSCNIVDTGNRDGATYEDYLKIFAYFMDEDIRLLRMMDIIQINMKYLYARDFLLREYNSGLSFCIKVKGKTYEMEEKYYQD